MTSARSSRDGGASGTAARILDVAERLVQERGYNGFSYADIAAALKITTASLHYHFAGKAELGQALINRYATRFMDALAEIEAREADALTRLEDYANLYAAVLREQRLCLCGMLASEYATLPDPMRQAVINFFDDNEAWLSRVIEAGRGAGELRFEGTAAETARMLVGGLEGAMLVTRPYGNPDRFRSAAARLISSLAAPTKEP